MSIIINKSFTYIYPMVKDIVNYENNLLNCYIKDLNKPEYNNHIFLRYKFDGSINGLYSKFEEKIKDCELLETFYDVPIEEGHSIMFVFKIPEGSQADYDNFIKSKYSKLSDNYKKEIIGYHGRENAKNAELLEGILYQKEERRKQLELDLKLKIPLPVDAELSGLWEEQNEYFPIVSYSFEDLLKDSNQKV